jgi:hypothetical protein
MKARSNFLQISSVVVCGLAPVVSLYYVFADVVAGRGQIPDFRFAYYPAAKAVLAGHDIFPSGDFVLRSGFVLDYVYPPLTAIAVIPFTVFPVHAGELIFASLLVLAFIATLAVLGVRDWRCYGLAFVWPPVLDAIQTGNVTIPLCLFAALVWRFRDRPLPCGASLGLSLATKILLGPLAIWLVGTRRLRAGLWTVTVATLALVITWGAIGFRGLVGYPALLHRLSDFMDSRSYSVYALGVDLGLPSELARLLWLVLAVSMLAATWILARRGDDRRAFVLALTAALACSPIVWLHYFALLLVAVAIMQPRLGPAWFIGFPLQAVVSTGVYNGSTFQTAAVLATVAFTVGLILRNPTVPGWLSLSPARVGRGVLEPKSSP